MTRIFDASALVAALISENDEGRWALDLLSQSQAAAPQILLAEVANVLRRTALSSLIADGDASLAFKDLVSLRIELYPFLPFADRIWELRHQVTAYDAWYVALAETLDSELITLDQRLARAHGLHCHIRVPD